MKKLFALLLTPMLACGQMTPYPESDGPFISPELDPIVEQFLSDADYYGVDVMDNFLELEYIILEPTMTYPFLGYTDPNHTFVLINENCQFDQVMLKFVVYHEMSHAVLRQEHCSCEGIMRSTSPTTFAPFNDPVVWKEAVQYMFSN